jgi:hypothetical protein
VNWKDGLVEADLSREREMLAVAGCRGLRDESFLGEPGLKWLNGFFDVRGICRRLGLVWKTVRRREVQKGARSSCL